VLIESALIERATAARRMASLTSATGRQSDHWRLVLRIDIARLGNCCITAIGMAKNPAGETISGEPVSDERIRQWADVAEKGFDVEELRRRGRPRLGEGLSTVIPVRMDEDLPDALNEKAEHDGISRSEAIREAVRSWTCIA